MEFIKRWYLRIAIIIIGTCIWGMGIGSVDAQEGTEIEIVEDDSITSLREKALELGERLEEKIEKIEGWILCSNPDGCIGKLDPKLPVCSICQFPVPVSTYSAVVNEDNIAQEIVNVLKEAHLLDEKIREAKAERERKLQERLASRKLYDLAYAQKVLRNAIAFRDAKAWKLAHIESGKEDVEGSLPFGTYRGKPNWVKEADFILYPKVRPQSN